MLLWGPGCRWTCQLRWKNLQTALGLPSHAHFPPFHPHRGATCSLVRSLATRDGSFHAVLCATIQTALSARRTQNTNCTELNFGFIPYPAFSCHNLWPHRPTCHSLESALLALPDPRRWRHSQASLFLSLSHVWGTRKTRWRWFASLWWKGEGHLKTQRANLPSTGATNRRGTTICWLHLGASL